MRYLLACLLLFISVRVKAQQPVLLNEIVMPLADFTADNLGNIYLLTKDNRLKKFTEKGDSVSVYNDVRRFGKVYSIDASNPLKLLLYYKDFSTVVELDRLLNIRNTIDLKKIDIFQPRALGLSNDNRIWVYDELNAQLKKVDENGALVLATTDLRQTLDSLPSPSLLTDQEAVVYLYDSTKGVYLFDYFGTFRNRIPFRGWNDFQVVGKYLFGRKGSVLYRYETGSLSLTEQEMGDIFSGALKVKLTPLRLYILYSDKLSIYSL